MDIDLTIVADIVSGNMSFPEPAADGSAYFIVSDRPIYEDDIRLYYEKLKYAAENAKRLIAEGFREEFFDFYGIDRKAVSSPAEMCGGLVFDSFVLLPDQREIKCCVSNPDFMFGHFIEYTWDYDWDLRDAWIN